MSMFSKKVGAASKGSSGAFGGAGKSAATASEGKNAGGFGKKGSKEADKVVPIDVDGKGGD